MPQNRKKYNELSRSSNIFYSELLISVYTFYDELKKCDSLLNKSMKKSASSVESSFL